MIIVEIQTTFPDEKAASHICGILIADRLIACVNIVPAKSLYPWKGDLQIESECIAFIKTSVTNLDPVIQRLKAIHPYELPAILYWVIQTTEEYGTWVQAQSSPLP